MFEGFTAWDAIAVGGFVAAWVGYHFISERTGRTSLNAVMNEERRRWMLTMLTRENRIVDTTIMAALQSGTAFFASTALLAVGGSLAMMRAAPDAIELFRTLPFLPQTTVAMWEMKSAGLAVILVYAFFKFGWAYRLFNYKAILIGATPLRESFPEGVPTPEAIAHAERAARLSAIAGRHFNRGQRAFFFALGYLGWFVGPQVLVATTLAVLFVMWRRQFASDSLAAVSAK
jgi:uncharacterized membrane protein